MDRLTVLVCPVDYFGLTEKQLETYLKKNREGKYNENGVNCAHKFKYVTFGIYLTLNYE
jgi:hypothetical protein